MKTLRICLLVLIPVAAASVGGCFNEDPSVGYTTQDLYVPGIKTVAVPIWTRGEGVYRRGLEFQLTEAVIKRIEQWTRYKVVSRARADTLLTGSIDTISQRSLGNNPDTGRPREIETTAVLSFTWTDLRSGKILKQRSNVRIAGTYLPSPPFGEEFFQGYQDVANRAARRVVEQMERDW